MFLVVVAFAVAGVAVAAALGRGDGLAPAPPERAPSVLLPDGPVTSADVAGLRFGMAWRGYRMDEVDAVLDRLAAELAARDERIAELARPAGRPEEG